MMIPFYDPMKSYEENFEHGPFGAFKDKKVFADQKPPQHTFLGYPVHVPFGIAAGPLLNAKFIKAALDKGFDLVVYKTVRTHQQLAHPWPNIVPIESKKDLSLQEAAKGTTVASKYKSSLAITNSFGVPSADPQFWLKDAAEAIQYAKPGQLVIMSFQGSAHPGQTEAEYIQDFVLGAELAAQTGAKVLEVNMSCPNENSSRLLCFDIPKVKKIILAIRKKIGNIPLILKTAYFENQQELEELVTEVGPLVDAFASINTIPAKIYARDGKAALPGEGRLISGVCGGPIHWAGLDMIRRMADLRKRFHFQFALIGVGGVSNKETYLDFRNAGADAVMSATGAIWNPFLAQQIKKEYSY
jgi:dihydroorotate dehydrogenase (NAD+) catalytic subunit